MKFPDTLTSSNLGGTVRQRTLSPLTLSRREALALPLLAGLAACSGERPSFAGFAFVANQDGNALAAIDLGALALARHIPLEASPTQVLAIDTKPKVFALTPATGTVHEVSVETLSLSRSAKVTAAAVSMALSPDQQILYVLGREPAALIALSTDDLQVLWRLRLPEVPTGVEVANYFDRAIIASGSSVRFVNLTTQELGPPLAPGELSGEFGDVRFLSNGGTAVVPDLALRRLTLIDTEQSKVITHLPLAVRPDHLCFSRDGGQLFITGEGMDAVVTVYPYNTPEVASTVLAGRAPGAMAASESLLFVASPSSGDVSIMDIATGRVIAVVAVGNDPGVIAVTPQDEYALVLNRESGDIAVLRVDAITPNRYRSAALLTMIPAGSRPVSIAMRSI